MLLTPIVGDSANMAATVVKDNFVKTADNSARATPPAPARPPASRQASSHDPPEQGSGQAQPGDAVTEQRRRPGCRRGRRPLLSLRGIQELRAGPGADRRRPRRAGRQGHRADRRQRSRQIRAGQVHRRDLGARRRRNHLEGRTGSHQDPARRRPGHRDRVPGPRVVRQPRHRAEHVPRPRTCCGPIARRGRDGAGRRATLDACRSRRCDRSASPSPRSRAASGSRSRLPRR